MLLEQRLWYTTPKITRTPRTFCVVTVNDEPRNKKRKFYVPWINMRNLGSKEGLGVEFKTTYAPNCFSSSG